MISKRNKLKVQNYYNLSDIKDVKKNYLSNIDTFLKDVISDVLSKNKKEIQMGDLKYYTKQIGGNTGNNEGYCDGPSNVTQCDPGSISGNCQLGGDFSYVGFCDGQDNLSQCINQPDDTGSCAGGNKPHLMNLSDFKKESNKIINKYKNEIGYDKIKINHNALKQIRDIVEHSIIFA